MQASAPSPALSVTAQIRPEELPQVAAAGFRAVIRNRPELAA